MSVETLDPKVLLDTLVHLVLKDNLDPRENLDPEETRETLVHLVLKDLLALLVPLVFVV